MSETHAMKLAVPDAGEVSALYETPANPTACFVFAHGAGAGMAHPFMAALSARLADQGVATLRYQFPYFERGGKRVDSVEVATAAVRAAVELAARLAPGIPLFAGGKSFGGRMTSNAAAQKPLPVSGIAFVGFPLHGTGKPSTTRADHLAKVGVPMLFLQGTRDALADLDLLTRALKPLGAQATLELVDDADHAFHVRKSSGSTDDAVLDLLAQTMSTWFRQHAS
jgi:predicted alpha/beta-hydrolase family hydrolase